MLASHDVELILVGVLSAVVQGAPVTTFDVDIVHRRSAENVERLLRALEEMDATYRGDSHELAPTASHLIGPGHQLLRTTFSDVDCLGEIDGGRDYDALLSDSADVALGDGHHIRVLRIGALIGIKERAGRPKDIAALPALRATLDEIAKKR